MQTEINKVELRNLQIEDYKQLKTSMLHSYCELDDTYWEEEEIENLLSIFPEGQLVILVDDKVVGSALSILVNYKKQVPIIRIKKSLEIPLFQHTILMAKFYMESTFSSVQNTAVCVWDEDYTMPEKNFAKL